MALIYQITNTINGKTYFGATVKTARHRWLRHVHDTLTCREDDGSALHRAIRKYGESAFEVRTVYEHPNENFIFRVMEPFFISLYDTYASNHGYNMTRGGDSWLGKKHTEETKQKISEANSGRNLREEKKDRSYRRPEKSPVLWTHEHREKARLAKFGHKHRDDTKKLMAKKKEKWVYEIHCPDDSVVTSQNLRAFCKEQGISEANFANLLQVIKHRPMTHFIKGYTGRIIGPAITEEASINPNY